MNKRELLKKAILILEREPWGRFAANCCRISLSLSDETSEVLRHPLMRAIDSITTDGSGSARGVALDLLDLAIDAYAPSEIPRIAARAGVNLTGEVAA